MRWLDAHLVRAAAVGLIGVCLAAPLRAASDAPEATEPVIPPGQEEVLLAMLGRGATLPDGCSLSDGRIEKSIVMASYTCPLGEVVVQLSHRTRAPEGATESERFALVIDSGSPPDSLLDALAANVRRRESTFEWQWAAPEDPPIDGEAGEAPAPGEPR